MILITKISLIPGRSAFRQQPWAICSHTRTCLCHHIRYRTSGGGTCGWEGNPLIISHGLQFYGLDHVRSICTLFMG